MATSISSLANALLLAICVSKLGYFRFQSGWLKFLLKLVLANLLMFTSQTADTRFATFKHAKAIISYSVVLLVGGGALVYGFSLATSKCHINTYLVKDIALLL